MQFIDVQTTMPATPAANAGNVELSLGAAVDRLEETRRLVLETMIALVKDRARPDLQQRILVARYLTHVWFALGDDDNDHGVRELERSAERTARRVWRKRWESIESDRRGPNVIDLLGWLRAKTKES